VTKDFIQERVYLKGVSPRTVDWYNCSFKAFDGAMANKQTVIQRISELKTRGASHITINSYLRAVNAYFMCIHTEQGKDLLRIPRLKEEQKTKQTLSPEQCRLLVGFKPKGRNLCCAHLAALAILDTGLRASELWGSRMKRWILKTQY
jgi:hypothetical protein